MDGLYNKHEMVDNIIKTLGGISVRGETNVNLLSSAFQMLYALQEGQKNEDRATNQKIELLKSQLKAATEPKPEEPGGDVLGGEHYDLKFGGAENGND